MTSRFILDLQLLPNEKLYDTTLPDIFSLASIRVLTGCEKSLHIQGPLLCAQLKS